jgi:hypothetical protein
MAKCVALLSAPAINIRFPAFFTFFDLTFSFHRIRMLPVPVQRLDGNGAGAVDQSLLIDWAVSLARFFR